MSHSQCSIPLCSIGLMLGDISRPSLVHCVLYVALLLCVCCTAVLLCCFLLRRAAVDPRSNTNPWRTGWLHVLTLDYIDAAIDAIQYTGVHIGLWSGAGAVLVQRDAVRFIAGVTGRYMHGLPFEHVCRLVPIQNGAGASTCLRCTATISVPDLHCCLTHMNSFVSLRLRFVFHAG
jgi:hypothetical protein